MVQNAVAAESPEIPAALRATARHVRDLVRSVLDERTQQELRRFADELDASRSHGGELGEFPLIRGCGYSRERLARLRRPYQGG
jgi:hypothetical protein